jgi:hypothetical protein
VHSTVVPLTSCISETRISQMYLKSAQVISDLIRYFKSLLVFGRIHMNMLHHTRSPLSKLSTLLHIWFISCRMASVGLMHNLSKMMVIPYSAGHATQLEMPAECACMCTRHTKTYSSYRVYKSMNVPVLQNIQASCNQHCNRL